MAQGPETRRPDTTACRALASERNIFIRRGKIRRINCLDKKGGGGGFGDEFDGPFRKQKKRSEQRSPERGHRNCLTNILA